MSEPEDGPEAHCQHAMVYRICACMKERNEAKDRTIAEQAAVIERVRELLDRNTKPGYPMDMDDGTCYYCDQGLCDDQDGYQDDELMTPEHHKPECAWRQARELLAVLPAPHAAPKEPAP